MIHVVALSLDDNFHRFRIGLALKVGNNTPAKGHFTIETLRALYPSYTTYVIGRETGDGSSSL